MNGEPCDATDMGASARARHGEWEHVEREAVHLSAEIGLPENYGLAHVLARIEGERRSATAPRQEVRARGWLGSLGRSLTFRHGFAVACLLLLVQGGMIVHLWSVETPVSEFAIVRALPGEGGQHEPFIRIAFRPEATEQAMRTLLNHVQADVVAGPTQLGDYYLLVPAGKAAMTVKSLKTSAIIEGVDLVDDLPGGN